jgi:FAD/FMN-containing dehydrogenase
MTLLRDARFVRDVAELPAMGDTLRDTVVRGLFLRDERALPKEVVRVLANAPAVTVKVENEDEVRKLMRMVNGEEGTQAFGALTPGLPVAPEDMHYYRRALAMQWETRLGLGGRPSAWTAYPDLVPAQGGIQLDFSRLASVEIDGVTSTAQAQCGARWKEVWDRAKARGLLLPLYPVVPLDFAIGDAVYGDARFLSHRGDLDDAVNAARAINAEGIQVTHGFTRVPNFGTAYDLRYLATAFGSDLAAVTALSLRLRPRPPLLKNVAYSFPDPASAGAAVSKILASGRELLWLNLYDERGWSLLHREPAGPVVVEAGLGARESILALRLKALDASAAGHTARIEVDSHLEGPAEAYAKTAASVSKMLFVGELLLTLRHLPAVVEGIRGVAGNRGLRGGFFAAVTAQGQASLFPYFEAAKELSRLHDLSRALWDLQKGFGGEVLLVSRLAHVWSTDRDLRARLAIVETIDGVIDQPGVVEPPATLEKPGVFFAPQ